MKTLKFKERLAEEILRGENDSTWRLFDDKNLSLGDLLRLVNKDSGEEFAHATILSVHEKPLDEVVDTDFDGHERYLSLDAMVETFRGYYGDKVTPKSTLKIIRFRLTDVDHKTHDDRRAI